MTSLFRSWMILVVVLSASGRALADTGDSELYSFSFIAPIVNSIFGQNIILTFMASGLSIAGRLNALAMSIAGGLALISVLWSITMAMLSKQSILTAVMEPVIFSVLTLLLLTNYVTVVHDIVNLGQQVIGATGSSVGDAVQSFTSTFFRGFARLVVNAGTRSENMSFLSNAFNVLVSIVLLAVAALLILLALKDVISVFLIGPVVVGLGVALGPIFIATIPSEFTRKWFSKWLEFLINGAMLTAIAILVMVLLNEFISGTIAQITANPDGSLGKLIALTLIAGSLSKVFTAVPDFADGLFPGRTGAGKAISDAPAKGLIGSAVGVGKVGIKAAGLATQGVAAGVSAVGKMAARGAAAGASGGAAQSIKKAAQATGGSSGGGRP